MNLTLRIVLLVGILFFGGVIFTMLKKEQVILKYALIWLFSFFIMLIVTIFPQILYWMSGLLGIVNPVNLVFVLSGLFALLIILSLTSIVSGLNAKQRQLVQQLALLEKRLSDLESTSSQNQ